MRLLGIPDSVFELEFCPQEIITRIKLVKRKIYLITKTFIISILYFPPSVNLFSYNDFFKLKHLEPPKKKVLR